MTSIGIASNGFCIGPCLRISPGSARVNSGNVTCACGASGRPHPIVASASTKHFGVWRQGGKGGATPLSEGMRGSGALRRSEASQSAVAAALCRRTYSSSKVIHGWRGESFGNSPQPTVNNFGGDAKMLHERLLFLLNREVGHAGPGRRIPHSNVATFFWRGSLRVLRLVVKEYSEPFACKCKPAETNSYKSFPAARPACLA